MSKTLSREQDATILVVDDEVGWLSNIIGRIIIAEDKGKQVEVPLGLIGQGFKLEAGTNPWDSLENGENPYKQGVVLTSGSTKVVFVDDYHRAKEVIERTPSLVAAFLDLSLGGSPEENGVELGLIALAHSNLPTIYSISEGSKVMIEGITARFAEQQSTDTNGRWKDRLVAHGKYGQGVQNKIAEIAKQHRFEEPQPLTISTATPLVG